MNESDEPAFTARELVRTVSPTFSLRIDSLAIGRGQVCALLGPTGSGKSTLLRMLAGLEPLHSGSLGARFPPRATTLVFQRPLPIRGSVRRNLEYGLKIRGIRQARGLVDRWLDALRLTRLAEQSAASLSGGQLQLVALARALVVEPSVLLLDEPTSHLDPAHVALVEQVVTGDCRERGTTVVWATHNLFQARRVAQHVALLLDGGLVEQGPVGRLFDSPENERTRDFLAGRMVY
jgi:tungstate transport system ATP-binding protein